MNKKVAIINSYNCGSTGTIACEIGNFAIAEGYEVLKCFPKHKKNIIEKKNDQYLFGIPLLYKINDYICKITGLYGFFQFYNTKKLIKKLKSFKPSIIHLHNLHSSYVNLNILFKYIKKNNITVVWTLHDCWAFTGRCPHFTISKCERWKNGCTKCKRKYYEYPKSLINTSKLQWKRKNKLFNSIKNLILVTPSIWLNNLVKESFLKKHKSVVIRNGIDNNIFKPINSDIREMYNISNDKYILLGVAFLWSETKGLDVFIKLSELLDESYQIILVGTDDNVDTILPKNIISIHKTTNKYELAKIYSVANLFINPTREEMLGMVNIEANACGIPVVTFKTGGSPECITELSGVVCDKCNVEQLFAIINDIRNNKHFTKENCIKNSQRFNQVVKYKEYIELYNDILNDEYNNK